VNAGLSLLISDRNPPGRGVQVTWDELRGKQWASAMCCTVRPTTGGDEMRDAGLYVEMKPWQYHLFQ